MKAYQLKIIVKKTKPPVWRRVFIPAGITFSRLGFLINEIYELEYQQNFQFEFFGCKVQLEEQREGKVFQPSYAYDLQEASNTYIDDYFDIEKACSYYLGNNAFRIEIEGVKDTDNPLQLIKLKSEFNENERIQKKINDKLKKIEIITAVEKHFDTLHNLYQSEITKIYRSEQPISEPDNVKKSANHILSDMGEMLSRFFESNKEKEDLFEKAKTDEDSRKTLFNEIENEVCDIFLDLEEEVRVNYDMDNISYANNSNIYLRDTLLSYPKEELKYMARMFNLRKYSTMTIATLAEKIADEMLSESVMKDKFSLYTDEQILAFEYAIEQNKEFIPSEDIRDDLYRVLEDDYVYLTNKRMIGVPVDVIEAYQKINTEEFHKSRKQKVWLVDCMDMVAKLYAVAPIEILIKMYQKRKGYRLSKEQILQLCDTISEDDSLCVIHDNRVMDYVLYEHDMYLDIERRQRDKEFYIPSSEEVQDYVRNFYPSKESSYQRLLSFFEHKMSSKIADPEDCVINIYNMISMGNDIHDVMDYVNEEVMVFGSEEEIHQFVEMMMEVNNNTRMIYNRGHKPMELSTRMFRRNGKMSTIVPGSSHMAEMLMQEKDEIEFMGFNLDFDSNATEIPVTSISRDRKTIQTNIKKVYPNDPCPCGSGKKFKKCCGRQ